MLVQVSILNFDKRISRCQNNWSVFRDEII